MRLKWVFHFRQTQIYLGSRVTTMWLQDVTKLSFRTVQRWSKPRNISKGLASVPNGGTAACSTTPIGPWHPWHPWPANCDLRVDWKTQTIQKLYRNYAKPRAWRYHELLEHQNSHQINFILQISVQSCSDSVDWLNTSCPSAWLLTGKDWSKKSAKFAHGKALPENVVPRCAKMCQVGGYHNFSGRAVSDQPNHSVLAYRCV